MTEEEEEERRPTTVPEGSARPSATAASYAVGLVNYRTYEDLERSLVSVKSQSIAPTQVVVIDADSDPASLAAIALRHPEVEFEARPNGGYAAGANAVLAHVQVGVEAREGGDVDFVLLMNPDVVLDEYFAENLLDQMSRHHDVALGSGKLLRPDGVTIDSAGIVLPSHRRPRDRGSEELDRGQYDETEAVFGATGAALMIRRAALRDLEVEGEIFDEDFFMYHEDTDLSWRANLLGWRVLYVPAARAIHGRRWRREGRYKIAVGVRRHSFKNHYLQVVKNERLRDLPAILPVLLGWEVARAGFLVLRDRALLPAYVAALRLLPSALRKRRVLQRRAAEPGRRNGVSASSRSNRSNA